MSKTSEIQVNSRLLSVAIVLAVAGLCPTKVPATTGAEASTQVRLYIPDIKVSRLGPSIPVVVECTSPVRIDRVGLLTESEHDYRNPRSDRTATRPAPELTKSILIVTYENLSDQQRPFLIQTITPLRLISIEGTTLAKVFLQGPKLMPGNVRLRAYLVVDGKLIAESPFVTLQCVEE